MKRKKPLFQINHLPPFLLIAKGKNGKNPVFRTLGPVSDLEKHLPPEWWKSLFNAFYPKTDGDVLKIPWNTSREVDLLIRAR